MTKRAVRVKSQLESHKRFANAFPRYSKLVDSAKLYCTNVVSGPPKVTNKTMLHTILMKWLNLYIININMAKG
jgi:hypothetical protein